MTLPAPPADRLPDGFRVVLDPRTRRRDGGAALLGGSPLRLLRLAPRARALLTGDALTVTDPTTAALAARLLDAGLAHPHLPPVDPADVTVVVPVKDRTAELDRLLRALRADLPGTPLLVVDDGSADPAATAGVCAASGARVIRHATARGPSAARNAGLAAATTTAVAFVDSDCVPVPGWLGVLAAHLVDPRLAVVAPRVVALPADRPGWVGAYEDAVSALDMGPRPAPVAPLTGVSYVPSAALLARRTALGGGFDEDMQVAEDVDLVWRLAAAGWRVRYDPVARVAHEHPARTGAWLRRRAYYGTGAALLAQRHGSAVAPVVMSPWSAAAWGLALLGGRPGLLGAAAVLGGATAKLAPRLGDPPPAGLAATLVVRGSWSAGRTLARSVTRHHWPLVVPLLGTRRVRRLVLAAAAVDAAGAWWPHRHEVGPLRFAAGRRLEDLAYGAGLWRGALRARSVRALSPARPR
ncbi:mycofactocin biosynthesis glycosyltransferase MftF [Klenkia taihuensis]|uniref:Mycofactocin system glycosyltransferase n=1 Tax=Klenkia taihuensis TaxID=1225127 RepID=A0A1I1HID4_9ACTN|nr:mycofactocin biosynthesis glycosyltransferase MftF [Klenkia taihuensis]GHE09156.1 putative glycosyltransferase [Klenkia taihuensis]SFC23734.1 mycofactocin system glycosyltransferase [Klenkia taihuensis]